MQIGPETHSVSCIIVTGSLSLSLSLEQSPLVQNVGKENLDAGNHPQKEYSIHNTAKVRDQEKKYVNWEASKIGNGSNKDDPG